MSPFLRRQPAPSPLFEAWRAEEWKEVVALADNLSVSGKATRASWLMAASALERQNSLSLSSSYTTIANRLYPASGYDSTSAFAAYARAPYERDRIAEFIVDNYPLLEAQARKAVASAPAQASDVYMYWDTPERPAIVDACFDAAREHLPSDANLLELDAHTAKHWTGDIDSLLNSISHPAHRSDLIRLELLASRGGTWIDATCFLRPGFKYLHERICEQDLFMFTYRGSRTGNWFMHGKPRSYRLQMIRAVLHLWLEKGNPWTNYFFFHDVVEMLYWTDPTYRSHWDQGLFLHPREALEMGKVLTKRVADHEWRDLLQRSTINKLSWKFPEGLEEASGTVVARILADHSRLSRA